MQLERLFHLGPEQAISAQDVFTNRHAELRAFEAALGRVREQRRGHPDLVADLARPRRNALVYYGMGGIGKTTLSKELQRRFDERELEATETRLSARIDFAELPTLDLETTLLRIRACLGGIGGAWPAFDLALAAYWERAHPGEPLKDFVERHSTLGKLASGIGLSNQVQEALDAMLGGAGVVGTAWRAGELVKTEILRRLSEGRLLRDCPFFEPLVTEASPEKARLFFPVLLAWDLAAKQRRDDIDVTIFLDTWEAVQASPDDVEGVEDALTRLVYLMPNVLFVVTGRSQVTWADETRRVSLKYAGPTRWPDLVVDDRDSQQLLIGSLSAQDSEHYLSQRLVLNGGPAIPREIRRRIVEGSEGLPLYLDLSADHFDELVTRGTPRPG